MSTVCENSVTRRRQCIDHALKKTKIEVKTEPTTATNSIQDEKPKTNGITEKV